MKTARQIVKAGVSAMFWNNKGKILTLDMMTDKFLRSEFWDSMQTRNYFAEGYGIKGTIANSIHELRTEGRFIFSPDGVNGYLELPVSEEEFKKCVPKNKRIEDWLKEIWDKIWDANEKIREQIPRSERKTQDKLLNKYKERLPPKLRQILIKHAEKRGRKVKVI